jgi:preprotein translocase subunit SecE
VAKVTSRTEQSLFTRVIENVTRYFRDTRAELRKVTWPSREEGWHLTLIVLGATVGMSIILATGDFIFSKVMQGIVTRDLVWMGAGVLVIIGGVAAVYYIGRE